MCVSHLPYPHLLMKNNIFIGHVSFYRTVNTLYCTVLHAKSKGFISTDCLSITARDKPSPFVSLSLFSRSADFRWKSGQHSSLNSHVLNGAKKNQENRLQKVQKESIYTSVDVCEMRGTWDFCYNTNLLKPRVLKKQQGPPPAGEYPRWVDGTQ